MRLTHSHRLHILGDRHEEFSMLPDLAGRKFTRIEASKVARRTDWLEHEKRALIDEDGEARNKDRLDIKGTHYEAPQEEQDLISWPFI